MAIARLTMPVSGFGCGGDGTRAIERALAKLPGVVRVSVNPATEMAYIECDAQLHPARLVEAVRALGFDAQTPTAR